ncbi:MAG TPA: aminoacetone oxidase family FAD-binding enzyme [Candidatus Limiplasma sp.]|nr:aminoacetone oxidase family FAD-binding enzyme [Candidatus Limiplasma sp.]HPS81198.1 aminoacetone oxidase family FAD-binding enzyme [Candidatus Limiplasma sp.]
MVTAIIGGGAAGIAAAITAAENGQRVLILERNRKPLKKLGITGNGRANLLNIGPLAYYGDEAFARAVLEQVSPWQLCDFLTQQGLSLREEGANLIYPAALQASVAVDALSLRAAQLGVTFLLNAQAVEIARLGNGFRIHALQTVSPPEGRKTGNARPKESSATDRQPLDITADRVIVTVGGAAAPAQGTDGSAYGLLTAFGHKLIPTRPALCGLLTEPRRIEGLSGQRARVALRLLTPEGQTLHATAGEMLFGEDSVSGIAAMQLARFVTPGTVLSVDLRPATGWQGLRDGENPIPVSAMEAKLAELCRLRAGDALGDLLTGTFSAPIARWLLREARIGQPNFPLTQLPTESLRRLAQTIADVRLPVPGTRGFDQAQVTAGGISTEDFNPTTMESKCCPGLYAAGEVLNVDGDCGGFNLMFAFASGILAGKAR